MDTELPLTAILPVTPAPRRVNEMATPPDDEFIRVLLEFMIAVMELLVLSSWALRASALLLTMPFMTLTKRTEPIPEIVVALDSEKDPLTTV